MMKCFICGCEYPRKELKNVYNKHLGVCGSCCKEWDKHFENIKTGYPVNFTWREFYPIFLRWKEDRELNIPEKVTFT